MFLLQKVPPKFVFKIPMIYINRRQISKSAVADHARNANSLFRFDRFQKTSSPQIPSDRDNFRIYVSLNTLIFLSMTIYVPFLRLGNLEVLKMFSFIIIIINIIYVFETFNLLNFSYVHTLHTHIIYIYNIYH